MDRRIARLPLVVLAIVLTRPALAEFNFDFSMGAAFTQDTKLQAKDAFTGTRVIEETGIDPSFSIATRFAYWIDPVPWVGFAMDFSYFSAAGGSIDHNDIFPMSFLVMGRATLLRTRSFPYGQLQPYAAVGPSIVFADTSIDLRPDITNRITDSTDDVGLDVRAGLAWEFVPHVATFVEYRFLYFEQHLDNGDDCHCGSITTATSKQTFATHFVLLGISLRF